MFINIYNRREVKAIYIRFMMEKRLDVDWNEIMSKFVLLLNI